MRTLVRARASLAIAGLAATSLFLSGCWLLPMTLDETADGSVRTIDVGDTIRIVLEGNISTGYQWIRTAPASLVGTPLEAVEEGEYEQDDQDVCGGPGTFSFLYRAVASGTIELVFEYTKPWEEEPVDTFTLALWVK